MEEEKVLDDETSNQIQDENVKDDIDLFDNKRRQTLTVEGARRATLGLPDNGVGLTKDYFNIDRPMSVTSLVDLIVMRRAGNEDRPRGGSTRLSLELEERIKTTLAWKEMEDELNKEDVMVNFRKKMRELRKEARQSIPREIEIERKINEERRIQLRTTLLEPNNQRLSTTESIKEAIHEFRTRQPAIIEESQRMHDYVEEEDKEATDIIQRTRELLQQMGYLKTASLQKGTVEDTTKDSIKMRTISPASQDSEVDSIKNKNKASHSESDKSVNLNNKSRSRTSSAGKARGSDYQRKTSQRSSNQPASPRNQISSSFGRADSRPSSSRASTIQPSSSTASSAPKKSNKLSD